MSSFFSPRKFDPPGRDRLHCSEVEDDFSSCDTPPRRAERPSPPRPERRDRPYVRDGLWDVHVDVDGGGHRRSDLDAWGESPLLLGTVMSSCCYFSGVGRSGAFRQRGEAGWRERATGITRLLRSRSLKITGYSFRFCCCKTV